MPRPMKKAPIKLEPVEPETAPTVPAESPPESEPPALTVADPAPEMTLMVLENTAIFRWNFEDIKSRLLAGIEKYTGLEVTEENLPDMEKTAREIASLRTQVNRFRLDTKKQLMTTAEQFDAEAKELAAIIAAAEAPLKDQLQKYEDARVQKREEELLAFAWKTCVSLGVRDEYYQQYQVPSKLTQRGTSDKTAKSEIATAMEILLSRQTQEDAEKRAAHERELAEAKAELDRRNLVKLLCETRSKEAGLKTALTLEEFERVNPIASIAEIAEIPGLVSREIDRRKKIEDAAATPPAPPPVFGSPTPGLNQPPTTPRPPAPPPAGPMPVTGLKLFDVTLSFRCAIPQAAALKQMFTAAGITYTVVKQEEVRCNNA